MKVSVPPRRKQRRSEIDWAKTIGVLLVVLGHNNHVLQQKGLAFAWIYSFHMPLFLFITGALATAEKPWREVIASKFKAILWPYILVNSLLLLSDVLRPPETRVATPITLIYGVGEGQRWTPLWYLPYYFLLSVLMMFAVTNRDGRPRDSKTVFLCWSVILVLSYAIQHYLSDLITNNHWFDVARNPQKIGLPLSADLLWIGIIFWGLGRCTEKILLTPKASCAIYSIGGAMLLAINFILVWATGNVFDMNMRLLGDGGMSLVAAVLGIAASLCIAFALASSSSTLAANFARKCGEASLCILIFHFPIQNTAQRFAHQYFDRDFANAMAFAAALIGSLIIHETIESSTVLRRVWRLGK